MPKRKKQRLREKLKPVFHIFCEGEKTEPNYLGSYIERKLPGTKLVVVEKTRKNTPVQLVEEATKAQKKAPAGDAFWVVYDREAPRKYPDALHASARHKAEGKVSIALSNVCFEVWLLLHFQSTSAPYDSCDDLLSRSALTTTHIQGYDKADRRQYSDEEIASARSNAERMNQQTMNSADPRWNVPHKWNPYTNVYELLDAIDEFGAEHC
ncbi:MAG: RloB domain-containing protein [Lentisphaeria bacterium]|nr:RloB domain-containing protein [Lentisphaeria bacterium]